jgi:hypothetical protein
MLRNPYLQKISFGKRRPLCCLENVMGVASVVPLFAFHVAMKMLVWILMKHKTY